MHHKTLSKYSDYHNLSIGLSRYIFCYKCNIEITENMSKFKDERQKAYIVQIQKKFYDEFLKNEITIRSILKLGSVNKIENKEIDISLKMQSEIVLATAARTTIFSSKDYTNQKIYCFKGLVNNGNTCFFNSIIQCLSNNLVIASKILANNEDPEYFTEPIPLHFKQFMQKIRNKMGHQNNPKELFENTLCKFQKKFLGYQQQDAHEAFIILMDGLIEENKKFLEKMNIKNSTIDQTFFGKIFSSKLIHNIFCLSCQKNNVKIDDVIDLSLAIDVI